MDEGRNMILLFPPLIQLGSEKEKKDFKEKWKPTCHMFYPQNVVNGGFEGDGIVKWKGLDNQSDLVDDEGKVLVEYKEGMKVEEMDKKKRKALDMDGEERIRGVKEAKV
jgi:hypothetical protein